jgi:hypothetical protein
MHLQNLDLLFLHRGRYLLCFVNHRHLNRLTQRRFQYFRLRIPRLLQLRSMLMNLSRLFQQQGKLRLCRQRQQ